VKRTVSPQFYLKGNFLDFLQANRTNLRSFF
jgi:hypothetical protein